MEYLPGENDPGRFDALADEMLTGSSTARGGVERS
jgi:hypothetical protein